MSPVATRDTTNPFPGLRPFRNDEEKDEEHLFFGREEQVDAMVDKLAATHFLAVVGTSGSGKSSLVNCGLRPALHRGLLASAGTAWCMAQFRPGGDPIGRMARTLAEELGRKGRVFRDFPTGVVSREDVVETRLRLSKRGLLDLFQQAGLEPGVNLLLVVDQFEELFRYRRLGASDGAGRATDTGADATAFVNLLLEVRSRPDLPIHVVLTMRSDFLGDCTQFTGLAEAVNAGQYLVPRMTRNQRRAAIAGPIGVGGAQITPVLLTRLVNDVGDNPDQLSILQHAMNRTWANWEESGGDGPLDLQHYQRIGTMARALDQHAEEAYAGLADERSRQVCERMFRALTDKATDARGVRRPTKLGTLCALADATEAEVVQVIDAFRDPSRSFLMPAVPETLGAESVIDISHESLMRVWQRLDGWATGEAESAKHYRRLAEDAVLHREGKVGLLQDPSLQVALNWRADCEPNQVWAAQYAPSAQFELAIAFLEESHAAAVAEARRVRQRFWWLVIAGVVLLATVGAVTVASFVTATTRTVDNFRRIDDAKEWLDRDSRVAGWLLDGLQYPYPDKARPVMADVLRRGLLGVHAHQGPVRAAAVTARAADGAVLVASGGNDGRIAVWRAENGQLLVQSGDQNRSPVLDVAFAPDGGWVYAAFQDGRVIAGPTGGEAAFREVSGSRPDAAALALATAGPMANGAAGKAWLAVAWEDGEVMVYDITAGEPSAARPVRTGGAAILDVALAVGDRPGVRLLCAGVDGGVWLGDLADEPEAAPGVRELSPDGQGGDGGAKAHGGPVVAASFSPDGRLAITASWDRTARVWDGGDEVAVLEHDSAVLVGVWRPDGSGVVTAGEDGVVLVWKPALYEWQVDGRLWAEGGAVLGVAFADATGVVTASEDGHVRRFRLAGGAGKGGASAVQPDWDVGEHRGVLLGVHGNPALGLVVSHGEDGDVRVWRPPSAAGDAGRDFGVMKDEFRERVGPMAVQIEAKRAAFAPSTVTPVYLLAGQHQVLRGERAGCEQIATEAGALSRSMAAKREGAVAWLRNVKRLDEARWLEGVTNPLDAVAAAAAGAVQAMARRLRAGRLDAAIGGAALESLRGAFSKARDKAEDQRRNAEDLIEVVTARVFEPDQPLAGSDQEALERLWTGILGLAVEDPLRQIVQAIRDSSEMDLRWQALEQADSALELDDLDEPDGGLRGLLDGLGVLQKKNANAVDAVHVDPPPDRGTVEEPDYGELDAVVTGIATLPESVPGVTNDRARRAVQRWWRLWASRKAEELTEEAVGLLKGRREEVSVSNKTANDRVRELGRRPSSRRDPEYEIAHSEDASFRDLCERVRRVVESAAAPTSSYRPEQYRWPAGSWEGLLAELDERPEHALVIVPESVFPGAWTEAMQKSWPEDHGTLAQRHLIEQLHNGCWFLHGRDVPMVLVQPRGEAPPFLIDQHGVTFAEFEHSGMTLRSGPAKDWWDRFGRFAPRQAHDGTLLHGVAMEVAEAYCRQAYPGLGLDIPRDAELDAAWDAAWVPGAGGRVIPWARRIGDFDRPPRTADWPELDNTLQGLDGGLAEWVVREVDGSQQAGVRGVSLFRPWSDDLPHARVRFEVDDPRFEAYCTRAGQWSARERTRDEDAYGFRCVFRLDPYRHGGEVTR